jgi:hypothetical protein
MHCDSWWDVPVANLLGLCKACALPAEGSGRWEAVAPSRTHPLRRHPCTNSRSLTAPRAASSFMSGVWVWKAAVESRPKAAARLGLDVSAGWVSPSSHSLWGDALLLSTRRCWKPNPGHLPASVPPQTSCQSHRRPSRPVCNCQPMCSLQTDAGRPHCSRSVAARLHPAPAACSRGVSEHNAWSVSGRAWSPQQQTRPAVSQTSRTAVHGLFALVSPVCRSTVLGRDQLIECSPRCTRSASGN